MNKNMVLAIALAIGIYGGSDAAALKEGKNPKGASVYKYNDDIQFRVGHNDTVVMFDVLNPQTDRFKPGFYGPHMTSLMYLRPDLEGKATFSKIDSVEVKGSTIIITIRLSNGETATWQKNLSDLEEFLKDPTAKKFQE